MTDHPIIFSSAMILALVAGRKTQTRRLAWRDHDAVHPILPEKPSSWQRVMPGDRLWVRENFFLGDLGGEPEYGPNLRCFYAADFDDDIRQHANKITPCIHMPRWASRLTLVVTATKIERAQAISEADALAEGITAFNSGPSRMYGVPVSGGYNETGLTARESFMNLWCTLHGPSAWADNPEVVALSFAVHKTNIDAIPKEQAA